MNAIFNKDVIFIIPLIIEYCKENGVGCTSHQITTLGNRQLHFLGRQTKLSNLKEFIKKEFDEYNRYSKELKKFIKLHP